MADINMDDVNIEIQSSSDKASSGVSQLIETLKNLNDALSNSQANVGKYVKNMNRISDIGKKIKVPSVSSITKSKNAGLSKELEFLNSKTPIDPKLPMDNGKMQAAIAGIETLRAKMESLKQTSNRITQRIKDMFKTIAQSKVLRLGIKALDTSFGNFGQKISETKNRVHSLIKSFSKYALALYGIRSAFYAVRNVTNEFLSSQNATAQQLSANISYLKYALGASLAPVITYITNLIYSLLKAIQYLVYYFAKVNIFAKSSAKSMAAGAGSAGKTTKELQKQLQAFDELNNINLENNAGSGGGGGGGGIAPDLDLSEIDPKFKYLFDDIENWGKKIAERINSLLYGINWTPILEGAEKASLLMTKILNDFTVTLDFKELGYSIAQGINTAIIFVNTFYQNYRWDTLGKQLGNGLNSMVNTLQWDVLGQLLTDKFRALILTVEGFVTTFEWKNLGKKLAEMFVNAFGNIPWDNLANSINEGITGMLDTLITFLDSVNWSEVGKTIGKFLNDIDWKEILTKLFTAIGKVGKGVVQILWNTIFSGKQTTALAALIAGFVGLKLAFSGLFNIAGLTLKFADFSKVAGGLTKVLPLLAKGGLIFAAAIASTIAVIASTIATIKGVQLTFKNFFDMLQNGVNKSNAAMTALGVAITSIGLSVGFLISPFTTIVAAVVGLKKALFDNEAQIKKTKKAQEDYNDAVKDAAEKQKTYEDAIDRASDTLERLEEVERETGLSGEALYKQVEEGTLTYAEMTQEQREVYRAYKDNKEAQDEATQATNEYNEAKKEEVRQSLENQLALGKESKSYDEFKKSVVEAYEKGEITADEARDLIERSMASMSKSSHQTFVEDLPSDITDGLDPNRYASPARKFSEWFSEIWIKLKDTVKNWFNTYVAPWLSKEKWAELGEKAKTGITNKLNEWAKTFKPIANWFNTHVAPWLSKEKWRSLAANGVEGIRSAFSNLNIRIKMPHFSWSTQPATGMAATILKALSLPASLPKLNVSWYAGGGYPTEGDLFFANEAGPEMIGKIGNKTTVANNDQITRAIAEATYQAVSKALGENQDSNQPIIVNVGNETLYKGMTRSRSQASNQYGITV